MYPKNLVTPGWRICVICFVLLAAVSSFGYFFWYKPAFRADPSGGTFVFESKTSSAGKEVLSRLRLKASAAKDFVRDHGFNQDHCFLIDMHIPSGKKRFFVYNLKKDSVELA